MVHLKMVFSLLVICYFRGFPLSANVFCRLRGYACDDDEAKNEMGLYAHMRFLYLSVYHLNGKTGGCS